MRRSGRAPRWRRATLDTLSSLWFLSTTMYSPTIGRLTRRNDSVESGVGGAGWAAAALRGTLSRLNPNRTHTPTRGETARTMGGYLFCRVRPLSRRTDAFATRTAHSLTHPVAGAGCSLRSPRPLRRIHLTT